MGKRYFYGRVSAKDQNLARQLESAKNYKKIDRVFKDKQSGKDFDRADYQKMKEQLNKAYSSAKGFLQKFKKKK